MLFSSTTVLRSFRGEEESSVLNWIQTLFAEIPSQILLVSWPAQTIEQIRILSPPVKSDLQISIKDSFSAVSNFGLGEKIPAVNCKGVSKHCSPSRTSFKSLQYFKSAVLNSSALDKEKKALMF